MRRVVEFDLVTKTPNAVRFASKRGMAAHAGFVGKQREKTRAALDRLPYPRFHVEVDGTLVRNRITVTFTRIAVGVLDREENLPMAFKHVKDEVATWCGSDNDRDPIFTWALPYGQRKPTADEFGEHYRHVMRARIEVIDLTPGADRVVVLAETASAARAAKSRVKRAVTKAAKDATYRSAAYDKHQPPPPQLHAAMYEPTKGTSMSRPMTTGEQAGRAAFRKMFSKGARPNPHTRRAPTSREEQLANHEVGERVKPSTGKGSRAAAEAGFARATGKPTALDLRDAYEAVVKGVPGAAANVRAMLTGKRPRTLADRMNGDLTGLRPESIASARSNGALTETLSEVAWKIQIGNDVEAMRTQARSVACPVGGCLAMASGAANGVADAIPCRGWCDTVANEYGVHAPRARAAGLPSYPTALELAAGTRPVCEETACRAYQGAGECTPGVVGCEACHGTGKVKAWRWVMPPAMAALKMPDEAGRERVRSYHRANPPTNDPGEELHPRQLKPCPRASCFAALDVPCVRLNDSEVWVNGVHVERAKAAGVRVGDTVKLDMTPWMKAPTNGKRSLVPSAGQPLPVYLRKPWERPTCPSCGDGIDRPDCTCCGGVGTMRAPAVLWKALDVLDGARESVLIPVLAEHQARFDKVVTVYRRAHASPKCWIYE